MTAASATFAGRPDRSMTPTDRIARGLGWLSLAIGLVELAAPGRLARTFGLQGREGLVRAQGGRGIATGIWALSDTPAPAIWGRAAGGVGDLAMLASALRSGDDSQRRNAAIALAAVAGLAVVDILVAAALASETSARRGDTGRDYGDRSGFPGGTESARGAASDFRPAGYRVSATEDRLVASPA